MRPVAISTDLKGLNTLLLAAEEPAEKDLSS